MQLCPREGYASGLAGKHTCQVEGCLEVGLM